MKIAVFSDVHGNLSALRKTLDEIRKQHADQLIFLGDIFQRGSEELECLDLLKEEGVFCLKGNCELYLMNGVDIDPDVEHRRSYYEGKRAELSDSEVQFLQNMPLEHEMEVYGSRLHFSHFLFSGRDLPYPFLQLSDLKNGVFEKACEREEVKDYDLVVIGHSHQNFERDNVVSISAVGLEGASYLMIEVEEGNLKYERFLLQEGE